MNSHCRAPQTRTGRRERTDLGARNRAEIVESTAFALQRYPNRKANATQRAAADVRSCVPRRADGIAPCGRSIASQQLFPLEPRAQQSEYFISTCRNFRVAVRDNGFFAVDPHWNRLRLRRVIAGFLFLRRAQRRSGSRALPASAVRRGVVATCRIFFFRFSRARLPVREQK